MNIDQLSAAIKTAFPVPEDLFEKAKWMGEAADAAETFARLSLREEKNLITSIQENSLTSDLYRVIEKTRPYAVINTALLKANEPEIYNEAVHVRAADAMRILGRRTLYDLMADALGEEIRDYAVVTVTDIRRLLPDAEAERYIIDEDRFVKFAVVGIDD